MYKKRIYLKPSANEDGKRIPVEITVDAPTESRRVPSTVGTAGREAVLKAFLASQDVKDSSRKTYGQSMDQYFNWLDSSGRTLGELSEEDVVAYKSHLLKTGHKALTVRSYLSAVRKFYRWTETRRLYSNIASNVKPPRINQGGAKDHFIKMHLTDAQAAELLEFYREHPRNYAIVNLMLRTGLRTIEVSRARISDIKLRSGQRILQVWGKGMDAPDPSVFVVLTDAAYGPIAEYLRTRPHALAGEPLFVTEGTGSNMTDDGKGGLETRPHCGEQMSTRLIQLIVKKGLRAIGLDDHAYSAHSLRHTTATQMLLKGASIMDVQRTLRHESIETSMIYVSSIQEEEHLRNAPESLLDNAFKKASNI